MSMIAAALLLAPDAHAQAKEKDEVVREIERGLYFKSNLGSTLFMNTHGIVRSTGGPLLSGVMTVQIGVGQEFVDKERFSLAWEADFYQGLFNGPILQELYVEAARPLVQGDVHMLGGVAGIEASVYPTRRLGLGVLAGGGIYAMPLLMDEAAYAELVAANWGGVTAKLHNGPSPVVQVTPTIEYYTKLSHFSVGIDVGVAYVIGFDLGITPSGYLKYTL